MYKGLYRALLREAAVLPDSESCILYRAKIREYFRAGTKPESSATAVKRIKQAQELLRQLKATNDGYLHAINRTLETTYARRGPQKHALLRPFILPSIPTKPSAFSPPLSALVTSSIAHLTRPPNLPQLTIPPSLPPRAFPDSEEARLLGPLTLSRIRKIRLRYFNEQTGKLRAPIAVLGKRDGVEKLGTELRDNLKNVGLAKVDEVKGRERLERLEKLSQVVEVPRAPKRLQSREERSIKGSKQFSINSTGDSSIRPTPRILPPTYSNTKWNLPRIISPRLLRRQYQSILQNSPIFTIEETTSSFKVTPSNSKVRAEEKLTKLDSREKVEEVSRVVFSVTRSEWAKEGTRGTSHLSAEDAWWLERDKANGISLVKKGGKRR